MSHRFAADVHLAKLARHLRMVGFDTFWADDTSDDELVRLTSEEGRILLTRDRALSLRVPPDRVHFVQSTDPKVQFCEVLGRFSLVEEARSHRGFLTRCLLCNRELLPVQPHQIHDRIPGHLLLEKNEFFLCPRCERVYWTGTHVERMKRWVDEVLALATDFRGGSR